MKRILRQLWVRGGGFTSANGSLKSSCLKTFIKSGHLTIGCLVGLGCEPGGWTAQDVRKARIPL